ncbi:hypothetical protein T10_5909 [Trichinella papuae]|uniref:Uncharacterized protein n=1 Tax=Trichinella papuae TaxID=268474 RepID=A0A0V1M0G0_9BILA|nr:hypothetical protein T10_5909 [Trichinella papuae]
MVDYSERVWYVDPSLDMAIGPKFSFFVESLWDLSLTLTVFP